MRDYIAFISYRHIEKDQKVARWLHRRIERYKAPRDIKTGRKDRRLGYVFRDQEELPASSNLTQDIYNALDHSRFLIVICSPDTKKSEWVCREVEYFLEHHDRSHVLAVLLGDPRECFIKPLIEEKDEKRNTISLVEPLAANLVCKHWWEMPEIYWKESLRLLAALVGCSFDSLFQREKHYRTMKRLRIGVLTAVILGAFIFTGVRNHQILKRKNEELLLQRASAAGVTLRAGDLPSALDIAVDALSQCGETPGKPRVLAEQALNDALMPYSIYDPHVAAVITQSEDIEAFELAQDGKTLLTVDTFGALRAFDLDSARLLWRESAFEVETSSDKTVAMLFLTGDSAIVKKGGGMCAWSLSDGKRLWTLKSDNNHNYDYATLSRDGNVMAFSVVDAQKVHAVRFVDTRIGEVIREIAFPAVTEKGVNSGLANNLPKDWSALGTFDEDNRHFYGYWFSGNQIRYYRIDLDSDAPAELLFEEAMSSDKIAMQDRVLFMYCLDPEGQLLVIRQPREADNALVAQIIDARSQPATCQVRQMRIDAGWQQDLGACRSFFSLEEHYLYGVVGRYMFIVNRDSLDWDTHVFDSEIVTLRPYPEHPDLFNIVTDDGDYRVCWAKESRIENTYGDRLDTLRLCEADSCALVGAGMIALERANLEGKYDIKTDVCDGRALCVPKVSRNSLWLYELKKAEKSPEKRSREEREVTAQDMKQIQGERHTASFDGDVLTLKPSDAAEPLWSRTMPFRGERVRRAEFLNGDRWLAVVTRDNRVAVYDAASGDELFYESFPLVPDSKAGVKAALVNAEIAFQLNRDGNRLYVYAEHVFGDGICIDTQTWTRVATLPNMYSYDPETGVITVLDTNYKLYEFTELETSALIERAGQLRRGRDS